MCTCLSTKKKIYLYLQILNPIKSNNKKRITHFTRDFNVKFVPINRIKLTFIPNANIYSIFPPFIIPPPYPSFNSFESISIIYTCGHSLRVQLARYIDTCQNVCSRCCSTWIFFLFLFFFYRFIIQI